MEELIGIVHGDEYWLASFAAFPIVCLNSRDEIALEVTGYQPPDDNHPPHSHLVEIAVRRKPSLHTLGDGLIYRMDANNTSLYGPPRLKWMETIPRGTQ